MGQYVSGDYWINAGTGSVRIISIEFDSAYTNVAQVGSTLNPEWGSYGYFDPAQYDSNAAGFDPAQELTGEIVLVSGDSLVSGTVFDKQSYIEDRWSMFYTGAVLTVVDEPQSPDQFRPPYCRDTRYSKSSEDPLRFFTSMIQWN